VPTRQHLPTQHLAVDIPRLDGCISQPRVLQRPKVDVVNYSEGEQEVVVQF
jgi:hypothetical protein